LKLCIFYWCKKEKKSVKTQAHEELQHHGTKKSTSVSSCYQGGQQSGPEMEGVLYKENPCLTKLRVNTLINEVDSCSCCFGFL
jgi:hypothetical protein